MSILCIAVVCLGAAAGLVDRSAASIVAVADVQQTESLAEFGIDEPLKDPKPHAHPLSQLVIEWVTGMSFAFFLKAGAITSSVIMTFSPMRAVWRMHETASTLAFPPFTFVCGFACGLQWCIYGTFAFMVTQNYGFLILVYSNAIGVLMGSYYVHTYYVNCKVPDRMVQMQYCATAAFIIYTSEAFVIPLMDHTHALLIVGTVSACLSIMVSVAPIADLPYILVTKDVSGVPKDVVIAGFICSILWFGCALLLHDMWILIPNLCGVVLGGFQLMLLSLYSAKTPMKPTKAEKGRLLGLEAGTVPASRFSDGTGGTPMCADSG